MLSEEDAMRTQAQAVIIGGGGAGGSIAYHLTLLGWRGIVLVGKGELTSGSTFFAAGLVGPLPSSATPTRMTGVSRRRTHAWGRTSCRDHGSGDHRREGARARGGDRQGRGADRLRGARGRRLVAARRAAGRRQHTAHALRASVRRHAAGERRS